MKAQIVVTGSHGGLPGARKASAIKAKVQLAVFNDAGVGIDDAGIKRLDILEDVKVAAVAVDAWTARIGSGRSSYETGEISFANASAAALGAKPKMRVINFLQTLAGTLLRKNKMYDLDVMDTPAPDDSGQMMTGGEAIAEILDHADIGPVFGMGGFQLLPLYEALRKRGLPTILSMMNGAVPLQPMRLRA